MNSPTVRSIPLSPGRCYILGKEDRTSPALGQRPFEHQYFIAKTNYIAVYKSHRAVCSFIEVVQNTDGTASPRWHRREGRGQSQGGQARSRGNTLPRVLVPRGRGFGQRGGRRLPLRQGARSSHHVHHGQRCPRGHGAGGAPCQPHSHPHSLFPCSPSPWSVVPVLEQGKAPQPPRNSEGWETGKTCWNDTLKKQR